MEELLHVNIFGTIVHTTVTASEEVVNRWLQERPQTVQGRLHPGLDIQPVHSVQPYPPIVATIQVCVDSEVLIYHMYNNSTLPPALEAFITNPKHRFQGVNLSPEISVFRYQTKLNITYVNLAVLAAVRCKRMELEFADVNELAFKVLGKRLEMPGEVNPDWNRPVLDTEQVIHACIGAYVAYQLGNELRSNSLLAATFCPAVRINLS